MFSRRRVLKSLGAAAVARSLPAQSAAKPNILLILADDLGFSDLGCFGGEIETPNLDALAAGGVRFTQLYDCARCCPSRAALLTGQYPHRIGMGNMVGGQPRPGYPGYAGKIAEDVPFLPSVLKEAGYSTYMSGKWHLGQPTPVQRGFDEFYGMLHGFDSFWDSSRYTRLPAGRPLREFERFYATDAITDYALDFLTGARRKRDPWFLYLAYNAPHFPLHAPKSLIDKYQPVYEKGWDAIRTARFERMKKLGVLDKGWDFTPRSIVGPNRVSSVNGWAEKENPAWDSLPEDRRKDLARRMAIFAAMVHVMDQNIGRVIADLKKSGEFDNTLILFCSDNGACAEWDPWGFDLRSGPDNVLHTGAQLDTMGQPGSYHSYGSGWANASNTPWRLYKHYTHEGGIASPCIVHWPSHLKGKGAFRNQLWHFIDVLPTLASVAGAPAPKQCEGENVSAMFSGKRVDRGPLFWEHEGSRAVREGKWKLTAVHPEGAWELYDMDADRPEMHNLASAQPQRVQRMARMWDDWARKNQVLPWIWTPAYKPSESAANHAR